MSSFQTNTMGKTTNTSTPPDNRAARRAARVAVIQAGALVRAALGQGAAYEVASDEHIVIFRGKRFIGETVDAAIDAAQGAAG